MKIDQVFIYYLLKYKELPLQGIGTFRLEGAVSEPSDPDKPFVIPADAISFEYNPRITEDANLVNFISETTGKIKPLASADLDSYLMLGKQFINIGKPLIIPNIGTIEKTNSGELIFKGGQYVMDRLTPANTHQEMEEAEPSADESFSDFPRKRSSGRATLYIILVVILAFIAWAVWRYAFNGPNEETLTHTTITPLADSTAADTPNTSTSNIVTDSIPSIDSTGFKVVVGVYRTLAAAQNRITELKKNNRNVVMYTTDSTQYKIAETFNLPLSDTARILDSLKKYYGTGTNRPYKIEP